MIPVTVSIHPKTIDDLRTIRLWHWRKVIRHRHAARKAWTTAGSDLMDRLADEHLRYVIALNDFFPEPGDTAERDAYNEDQSQKPRQRRRQERAPR